MRLFINEFRTYAFTVIPTGVNEERVSGVEESVNTKYLFLNKDIIKHTLYPLTDPSTPIVARDDKIKSLNFIL